MMQRQRGTSSSNPNWFAGKFGLEVEAQRYDLKQQRLSRYPHPTNLGDRRTQPYFQSDFTESMEELVTTPQPSTKAALSQLHTLQSLLQQSLRSDEIMWPLSMPPAVTDRDLELVKSSAKRRPWYADYLNYLLEKYGPLQQLIAGVHINYSPTAAIISAFQQQGSYADRQAAQTALLFSLAQQLVGYRWLITYLFGATPVSENANRQFPSEIIQQFPVRSLRSSSYGYANRSEVQISYASPTIFFRDLQAAVATQKLASVSEFYGPVRLKGGDSLTKLQATGPQYVEFRLFDDDPFSNNGISAEALNLVHLLIVDALVNRPVWTAADLQAAMQANESVALAHPETPLAPELYQQALQLEHRLSGLIARAPLVLRSSLAASQKFLVQTIAHPNQTRAGQLLPFLRGKSLTHYAQVRGCQIKTSYANQTADQAMPEIPTKFHGMYLQALQLGFPVMVTVDQHLKVTINGRQHYFTKPVNLTNWAEVN
ncbi:Glutamate--cysteine ligase [Fructilactobacillus florum 8D]|uniref:Glutamate--cysteine ligase n=1 Tax=Fructilactobacillus florum 8D TaxID=1221538 RepID=W9EDK2_9LACO|nr:glutamate--cysteine ligase [Fructilactobacillus florum]ETO40157.1 Glutamate--cysteine ligase [Fructilactobacillus florum 8D]